MNAGRKPDGFLLPWLAPTSVFLLTLIVFLPAVRGGFIWDDMGNLVDNPHYRGLGWAQLRWMFSTFLLGPYQPLSWVTYGLDYQIWGMNPFGYHLTNILLHSANALLLYFLGLRLFGGTAPTPEDRLGAAFAALAFSLHPLRVESAVWVTERRDVLSGFFFLLALLSWLRALSEAQRPTRRWYALTWGFYLLALLSKAMVVTLPAVLILLDVYPLHRRPGTPWRELLKEKVPFMILAAFFAFVGVLGQARANALVPLSIAGLGERIVQSLFGLSYYLAKTTLPLRLSPDYVWHWKISPFPDVLFGGLAAVAGAGLVAGRKRWPAGLAAFAYYTITLLPVLGLVKIGHQTVADHYTYLPCLGWVLLAGAGLRRLAGTRHRAFLPTFALGAGLLAFLSVAARGQIEVWHDPISFWRQVLRLNPINDSARNMLAVALVKQNRPSEAVLLWQEQLRLYPKDAPARRLMSQVVADKWGSLPDEAMLYNDAGVDLLQNGETAKAAWYFEQALKRDPRLILARRNLERVRAQQGRVSEH